MRAQRAFICIFLLLDQIIKTVFRCNLKTTKNEQQTKIKS